MTAARPRTSRPTCSSSDPRPRWSTGLADRLRARAGRVVGPGRRRGPPRGVQGLHEGAARRRPACRRPASAPSRRAPTPRSRSCDACPARGREDRRAGAGKGVLVTDTSPRPSADVAAKLSGRAFGDAGRRVVIEEGLSGAECSLTCSATGARGPARRRRRTSSGSATATRAPTPAGWAPTRRCPASTTVGGRRSWTTRRAPRGGRSSSGAGIDYRGVLYAGLMVTDDGPRRPRVQRPLRRPRGPGRRCRGCRRPVRPAARRRPRAGSAGRRRALVADGRGRASCWRATGYPGRPATGRRSSRARPRRPACRRRSRASRSSTRARRATRRAAFRHRRWTGARRCGARRRPSPTARRRAPTRRSARCTWPGRRSAATSPTARRGRGRGRDPPLQPGGHGGAVQRRGGFRGAGSRWRSSPSRRWADAGVVPAEAADGRPRAAPDRRRRVRRRRWPDARRSPTTTWPRSSTWSRPGSARPRRSWVHYGLTSSDVVDTALVRGARGGGRPLDRGGRRSWSTRSWPGRPS